ncbi:triphosphoribosyl-dephospho-CoA synthase MdcB [uncultured Rhodoblastus sp.]|uniref:triphosphoribosyl-dephospho-CoA synthase MdcB n=1 Tax=uncultured Rhodoblastus sp. TaxID=543037 RepID=UPI0026015012|nr:triphosphoribosyl-dephospho-CoA synthase MdcB [uncultured Rhodoblastus sp.]
MKLQTFFPPDLRGASGRIGRLATRALLAELALHPKPGLVSPVDNGAHDDMNLTTFVRSLLALRFYFAAIAEAGARAAPFGELQGLGIEAERRMLAATGGINTHRGAIFCLGFLAAAAGWRQARGLDLRGEKLAQTILDLWGEGVAQASREAPDSHGARAIRRHGARGAREELLAGLPTLIGVAVPVLRATLRRTGCAERAAIQCLFAIMAHLQDTNLLHRGGPEGLAFVQNAARRFIEAGGVEAPDWRRRALDLHGDCVALHLSPGGAADCLAAAWFVHGLSP